MNIFYLILLLFVLIGKITLNTIYNNSYNYEYEDDLNECSVDNIIDHFIEILMPDDYEEGKHLNYNNKIRHINETIAKFKRLNQYSQNISKKVEPIMGRFMSRMTELLVLIDLPTDCMASILRIAQSAQNGELWAMKFINSQPSLKISSDLSNLPFVDYDGCLGIESRYEEDKPVIKGQYCTISYTDLMPDQSSVESEAAFKQLQENLKDYFNKMISSSWKPQHNKSADFKLELTELIVMQKFIIDKQLLEIPLGFCLPTTCNAKDVGQQINKLIYPITQIPITLNEDCDYIDKPYELNTHQIFTISVLFISAVLIILSTSFEIWNKQMKTYPKNSVLTEVATSFSMVKNAKNLFSLKTSNHKFEALDGLRAILSFYVLIEHEFIYGMFPFYVKKINYSTGFRFLYEDKYMTFRNLNFIDTFFLLGAMMTCYIMISRLEKFKGKFNYIDYAIFRWLRTIPTLIAGIFAYYLIPLFGDGPIWKFYMNLWVHPCYTNWYYSFLMIENYRLEIPNTMICNGSSWYVSTDFQLFMIAPIVFLVYYYSPKIGYIWNLFLIILGIFIAISPKIIFGFPHLYEFRYIIDIDLLTKGAKHLFYGIETHFSSYMIGILLGYVVKKKPNIYLGGPLGELFLWICSWSLTAFAYYWTKDFANPSIELQKSSLLLWLAFGKFFQLAGWSWLLFACCTGRGGIINKILCWKGFKLLGQLSFEVCLLHMQVMLYRAASVRQPVIYNDYYMMTIIPLDYILTLIASIFVYFTMSGPMANLSRILMDQKMIPKNEKFNININNKIHNLNEITKL